MLVLFYWGITMISTSADLTLLRLKFNLRIAKNTFTCSIKAHSFCAQYYNRVQKHLDNVYCGDLICKAIYWRFKGFHNSRWYRFRSWWNRLWNIVYELTFAMRSHLIKSNASDVRTSIGYVVPELLKSSGDKCCFLSSPSPQMHLRMRRLPPLAAIRSPGILLRPCLWLRILWFANLSAFIPTSQMPWQTRQTKSRTSLKLLWMPCPYDLVCHGKSSGSVLISIFTIPSPRRTHGDLSRSSGKEPQTSPPFPPSPLLPKSLLSSVQFREWWHWMSCCGNERRFG